MPTTPGWYPHPDMANTLCWWDGSAWTERTAPVSSPVEVRPKPAKPSHGDQAVKVGAAITVAAFLILAGIFLVAALS